jgi:hypothetical protein
MTREKFIHWHLISEIFGDGETGKGDSGTGAGGLVHLTVHKGDL